MDKNNICSAKMVAHSKANNHEIATMEVVFPRFILAEFNTHRLFSRNSASSRAIPYKKMLKSAMENPFIPMAFQKDHPGMQGVEYLDPKKEYEFKEILPVLHDMLVLNFKGEDGVWDEDYLVVDEALNTYVLPLLNNGDSITLEKWWLKCRDLVIASSVILSAMGVTKQLCNRLLEPFMYHKVLITATEWENFFELRCPQYSNPFEECSRSKSDYIKANTDPDMHPRSTIGWLSINKGQSEIHMMALAEAMWDAYNESTPKELKPGEWHIPYGDNINDFEQLKSATWFWIKDSQYDNIDEALELDPTLIESTKACIATARCARLSYQTLGDNPKIDYEADIKLHDVLFNSKHFSPFEHCARAMSEDELHNYLKAKIDWNPEGGEVDVIASWDDAGNGWCNNFKGWIQYRYLLEEKHS